MAFGGPSAWGAMLSLSVIEARWRPALAVILLTGFVLRLAWALVVPVEPVSDSHAYHVFATNIAQHGVYGWTPDNPGAYWPVGTSAIIAGLYMVFGQSFTPVVVFNIVISVAVIAQVFVLARAWFGTATALAAAAVIALWPSLIMYVTILASEVIFIFLVLAGLMAYRYSWQRRWVGILLAGLAWTAAAYVRPVALLLPVVFGLVAVLRGAAPGGVVVRVIATGAIMALLIAPWTWRNYQVFGEPVLISTNFGPVFWMGNNPDSIGGYMRLPEWARKLPEQERARRLKDEAMAYVRAEPVAFLKRTAIKFLRQHERETIAVHWNLPSVKRLFGEAGFTVLRLLATGYWYLVLGGALVGIVTIARRDGLWHMATHPCLVGWMYFAMVHAVVIMGNRYHFPAIPFITMLAAAGLTGFLQKRQMAREASET